MTDPAPGDHARSAREIVLEVIDLSPQERGVALERLGESDPHLRAEVEALLRAVEDADAEEFMASPTAQTLRSVRERIGEGPGSAIGPYKLLQFIGEGGFGVVYLAEQQVPVRRKVAIKIIKPGMDSRAVVARFEAERQALALMSHPHIARVYDGGITDASPTGSGRPYFVMEYVVGDPITEFADAHELDLRARLALLTQVCQAVQHAHTKGVIHRDLKPANVLVSMVDGRPFAKVIDFGIAKSLASPLTDKTLFTEHRQLIGTPEYMSPEQAQGTPDLDTRTDVYALGVLLYELLTGLTPFDSRRLRSAAFDEMRRIIKDEEPPLPSQRMVRTLPSLPATAARRKVEPTRLGSILQGELDWIVMKSLEKDRARRYETPNQLAADIQRYLSGEAVIAAPPSTAYRLRKFVRRHKAVVTGGSAVGIALLVGIAGTTVAMVAANHNATVANQNAVIAQAAREELSSANKSLVEQTQAAEWNAYTANLAAAQIAIESRDWPEAQSRLEACPERLRNWVWGYLRTTFNDSALSLRGHEARPDLAVFSPDASRVLSVGSSLEDDGTARVWDADSGKELCSVRSTRSHFSSAGFAPDGKSFYTLTQPRLWIGNESFTPLLQSWDASTGRELMRLPLDALIADSKNTRGRASISPDGSTLLWSRASDWRTAMVSLSPPGAVTWLPSPGRCVSDSPFSPDGRLVCTVEGDDDTGMSAMVWDVATREARFVTPRTTPNSQGRHIVFAAFSPDSGTLLTNYWSGCTSTWDLSTGQHVRSLFVPEEDDEPRGASSWPLQSFKFSAAMTSDGKLVATLLDDEQGLRVWELATGNERWRRRLDVQIESLSFSPDGRVLAVSDSEDAVWLLEPESGVTLATLAGQSFGGRTLNGNNSPFSSDGRRLVTRATSGDVCLWNLPLTPGRTEIATEGAAVYRSMFIPAISAVVAATEDNRLRVHSAKTGRPVTELLMADDADREVYYLAATSDGALVATTSLPAVIRVWDLRDGSPIAVRDFSDTARDGEGYVYVGGPRFLGSSLLVPLSYYASAEASDDSPPVREEMVEWDPATGAVSSRFSDYSDCGRGVSVSPSQDRIVFGAPDGRRVLVDATTGALVATLEDWAASGWAPPAAFSPNGAALAGVVREGPSRERVQIWQADSGQVIHTVALDPSAGPVQAIRFSPDGERIALVTWRGSSAEGGCVVLINASTGSVIWSVTNPGRNMDNLDFSPDGSVLVTSRRMDQCSTDVWSTATGARVLTLPYGLGLSWYSMGDKDRSCFSDDGTCLFVRDSRGQPNVLRGASQASEGFGP